MSLKNSKIIVIKIGSSLLVDKDKKIRKKWLSSFAKDIKKLKDKNKRVVIVSSGAIALGCIKMNFNKKNLKLDKSQAIASIGQIELMNLFSNIFSKHKLNISQILLTLEDTEERRRSLNAKRTFDNLFNLDFIPVVNENDTIATSEIKYGDNDRLASRVAQITNADTLVLLSDVNGLYSKNPKIYNDAKLIKKVENLNKELKGVNFKGMNLLGSGGMNTKIEAAKICQLSGCDMIISNGLYLSPIERILKKDEYTVFISKISKLHARKKWIISSVSPKGELIIDDGAKKALRNSKSLLAAGIKRVNGNFNKGDHVKIKILDLSNKEHKLSLGIKQVSENPWSNIVEEYETGKKITTNILEVSDKGATLKLDNNLEGIVLFKSLSKDQKKQVKEVFVPEFELEVAVQEVDEELKKIIFIVDFNEYLDSSSDDTEKEDE